MALDDFGGKTAPGARIDLWDKKAGDGPTQAILPVPDNARVTGVAIGCKDLDTLVAFCGNRIWKRKIRQHAMGAWSPWTPVTGTKL